MTKLLGADPDVEKLIRTARKDGWTVEVTGKNRLRWISPPDASGDTHYYVTPMKFGDKNRIKKIHKFLREHAGVEL